MVKKINAFFLNRNQNTGTIITFIFVIKLASVLFLVYQDHLLGKTLFYGIAGITEDSNTYIGPIDNYIKYGHYFWGTAQAGRMPYLGIIYYLFRLVLSKSWALSMVVIAQTFFEAVSIFYMATLCRQISNSNKGFWLFIGLACGSLYVTYYNYIIMSESFATSFLCLFIYNYYNFLRFGRQLKTLLIAAIFLGLAVLLKPYFGLLYGVLIVEIVVAQYYGKAWYSIKKMFGIFLVLLIPIIGLDTPWTIRNYIVLNKFVPFQQDIYGGYNYSEAKLTVRKFIQITGQSFVFWQDNTAGCYFEPRPGKNCSYQFPKRILNNPITMRKIEEARMIYIQYQRTPTDSLSKLTIAKFDTLFNLYRNNHRLYCRFVIPLILSKKLLIHSGSYYLPFKKYQNRYNFLQLCIKITQSVLYYACLILGFAGMLIMIITDKKSYVVILIPLYLLFFLLFVFRISEYRYFHTAYPFLLFGLCYFLIRIYLTYRQP